MVDDLSSSSLMIDLMILPSPDDDKKEPAGKVGLFDTKCGKFVLQKCHSLATISLDLTIQLATLDQPQVVETLAQFSCLGMLQENRVAEFETGAVIGQDERHLDLSRAFERKILKTGWVHRQDED